MLAFLSALDTPIARRFEVWKPDESRNWLRRESGFCETAGRLDGQVQPVERGQGAIGQAFQSGIPQVAEMAGAEPGGVATKQSAADATPGAAPADAAGFESILALPVIREGRLLAVAAWYF